MKAELVEACSLELHDPLLLDVGLQTRDLVGWLSVLGQVLHTPKMKTRTRALRLFFENCNGNDSLHKRLTIEHGAYMYSACSEGGSAFKDLDLLGPPGKDYSFEIECVEVIEFNVD